MPLVHFLQSIVNFLCKPQFFMPLVAIVLFAGLFSKAPWTARGGAVLISAVAVFFFISYFDPNFRKVASAPDNVPIVGMIFIVLFYLWYAMHQAKKNDARIEQGLGPHEGEDSYQKVFSWPDLVYVELICLLLVSALLIVWSIYLKAPLEEPANPTNSPNPAKAPWYFLGLQEMLVYFDPWLAGVVLPSLIIVGLMAIPFIDVNPKGNGYYTFKERKWEISIFLTGFLIFWIVLIFLGRSCAGRTGIFGPYEYWERTSSSREHIACRSLWVKPCTRGCRRSSSFGRSWAWRSWASTCGASRHPLATPSGASRRDRRATTSAACSSSSCVLMPMKMFLRWTLNLKYIVAIPEISFNI
jgi:hypothetical protein